MSKNVYFLNDIMENQIDAIVITKLSREEVQEIIHRALRRENCSWDDDVLRYLPRDCEVHIATENTIVYY